MRCSLHKVIEPLEFTGEDGKIWESYKVGDEVLVLIGLCTKDYVVLGLDGHATAKIDRKFIDPKGKVVYTNEYIDLNEEIVKDSKLEITVKVKDKKDPSNSTEKKYYLDREEWDTMQNFFKGIK